MLNFLALGLGVGAGVQAWRQWPPDGPVSGNAVAVVFVAGLACAFLGGLWRSRGRSSSVAVATATAEASSASVATNTNHVQLAVVIPGQGAHPRGVSLPSDQAPWLTGAGDRPQITAQDLDGMDFSELLPDAAEEHDG